MIVIARAAEQGFLVIAQSVYATVVSHGRRGRYVHLCDKIVIKAISDIILTDKGKIVQKYAS